MKKPLGNKDKIKDYIIIIFIFIILSIIYSYHICYGIFYGDSAFFSAVCPVFGIPFPTSFPLYLIIGYFVSLIPIINKSLLITAISPFFTILSIIYLYKTIILSCDISGSILKKSFVALISLLFGLSMSVWYQAEIAEIYGLNIFLLSLQLYFLIKWNIFENQKYLLLFCLCFGLGLCNHPIIMFTAPAYIIFIILNYKKIQINPKLIFKMFFLFLLPLCLYLIIMIRAKSNPVINIENPDTLSKLFDVMTARKYGMNLFSADSAELFKRFEYFIKLTINNFSIFELLLSASGICFLFFKNYKYLLLIMLIIISNVIISLNYKTADIDYYYLISFYSIALLSGSVIKFINNKIIIMFLILISLFFCWNKYSKNSEFCSKRGFFIESDIGKDIIAYIPENSILISGDILTPILNYYCYSENRGKKIVLISKNYFSEHYFRFLKNEYPDYIFPEVKDGTVIVKTGDVQDIIFDNLSKHKVFLTFDIPLINGYKLKKIIGNSFVLYEVLNPNFADDKNILIDDNQFKNNYKELLKKYESINNMINWEAYNSAKYIYEVLFSKIEYSLQKGDQQGFLKIFNDIIDIKPDYDEYYMRISNLFTLYGIYGEAEKCLLIVKPENRNELWNIFFGIIREKQNRKEEAVIFYKRSLEIKNNIDANIKLAYLYFNEKRFDEALFFFEQANSFVPGRLDILYNLAVSYYYAGKIDNSKKIVDALISSGNAEYSHKAIQLKHILNN